MCVQEKIGSGLFVFLLAVAGGGSAALAAGTSNPAAEAAAQSPHPTQALPAALRPVFYQAPADDDLAWGKLRYGDLVVTHAQDKGVPAALKSDGDHVLIAANDAHAAYPLTMDPLLWLEQKVTAGDGESTDRFGSALAISGTTALIGADCSHYDPVSFQCGPGAAYVFKESNGAWTQTQKLVPDDGAAGENFAFAVALDGAVAFVGAPYATINGNSEQGAVYVFEESNGVWTQVQKLTAGDGEAGDEFGFSVAFDGTTVVVGAYCSHYDPASSTCGPGAAYVFTASNGTWAQTAKLAASDGEASDDFGFSVAIDDTVVLVGAPLATLNGHFDQGAVYVFDDSGATWTQAAKLSASDGAEGDDFGSSVALEGGTALVGAGQTESNGPGAIYVFDESNGAWEQTQKLVASNGAAGDVFGLPVALSGTLALIGASGAAVNGHGAQGAAYVFSESGGTWSQTRELAASDGTTDGFFGAPVALDGTSALAGAYGDNEERGAAYFYGRSDLGLALSAPRTVKPGKDYDSQAIATNNASAASPAVTLIVAVPAAASLVGAVPTQGSCNVTPVLVSCDFGSLAGNAGAASVNVTLEATGSAGTVIENTVGVANATPPLTTGAATTISRHLGSPPPPPADKPPVAEDGTLATDENTTASAILQAGDPDGDSLSFSIVREPGHGTVRLADASRGAYTYTPDPNYVGSDSFTFMASDGQLDSNTAKVSITVNKVCKGCDATGGSGGLGWPPLLGLFGLVLIAAGMKHRRD